MRILRRASGYLAVAVLAGWLTRPAPGQSDIPNPPAVPGITNGNDGSGPRDPHMDAMRRQLEKARNDDRQKQIVEDTDKLLSLAAELKTDVQKSNKDTLSLDVVRKAEEIEKLAHSVKEKMKGS